MKSDTDRYLFISYYFPPVKVVGAVRLFHLTQELMKREIPVFVVTCRNRRYFRRDEGLLPRVAAIRTVPAWDWRTWRLRWSGNRSTTVGAGLKKTSWGAWLARIQESFPFYFLLGDGGLVYLLTAYLAASQYIKEEAITCLFTSYRPYLDHWVAYLLKRRFPHLYWIADFRDLHVDPVRRNVLWPRLQTWIDRQLMCRADLVTTVSQGLAAHLPVPSARRHVLRNAIADTIIERRPQPTKQFTITYTGSIYPGLQDPSLLFQGIKKLLTKKRIPADHLHLRYMGKDGDLWDSWIHTFDLTPYSRNLGELNWETILQQQCQSSINLLLSWSSTQLQGILTSKVYEYLSAGGLILAIVNGPPDNELEKIIAGSGGGRVFYAEAAQQAALEAFLMECYREWEQNGMVKSNARREDLLAYTWSVQVDEMLAVSVR